MLRSKILQMRLEHPEQKIDIVCRLRNFENPFVTLFARHAGFVLARICEGDSQRQFLCDEINCSQTHRELLQKTVQHKKQRLGCFDFALKLETLLERLRRPNQFEQSTGSSIGTLPHANRFGANSRPKLLLIQRRLPASQLDQPFLPSCCARRTPKTRWMMESIAMPMQTFVAGAEITSIGTRNQPIPPSMHSGTSVRLMIMAIATRTERATIQAMIMNNRFNQKRPVTRLDATSLARRPCK